MNKKEITPEKQAVGNKVRDLRQQLDLSQNAFAEKIELSVPQLSNIENGKALLQVEAALRLCKLCPEITLDWLYGKADKQDEETMLINFFLETFHLQPKGRNLYITIDNLLEQFLREVLKAKETRLFNSLPDNVYHLLIDALKSSYKTNKQSVFPEQIEKREYLLKLTAIDGIPLEAIEARASFENY